MSYSVPLFPLPGMVLFPRTHARLHVFEPRYRQMTESSLADGRKFALCHLRAGYEDEYYGVPPVHRIATAVRILMADRLGDGRWDLTVEGIERIALMEEVQSEPFRIARAEPLLEEVAQEMSAEIGVLMHQAAEMAEAIGERLPKMRRFASNVVNTHRHPGIVADILAGAFVTDPYARQSLLDERDIQRRLQLLRIQLETLIYDMKENGIPVNYSPKE